MISHHLQSICSKKEKKGKIQNIKKKTASEVTQPWSYCVCFYEIFSMIYHAKLL